MMRLPAFALALVVGIGPLSIVTDEGSTRLEIGAVAQAQVTLHDQEPYNQGFGSMVSAPAIDASEGDTLTVCLRERDQSANPTISDTVNGSWSSPVVVTRNTTTARVTLFALHNSGAGAPVITLDYGGSNRVFQGIVASFTPTGTMTTSNFNDNGMTSTSHNANSVVASLGVLVACSGHGSDSGGESIGDTFTAFTMTAGEREYHRYKITSGETVDADYTTTNSIAADHVIGAFTDSGGGGGSAVPVIQQQLSH